MPGQLGKKVHIGQLRQFIQIQTPARIPDGFGGRGSTGWTTIDTDRAEVIAIGGKEHFVNGKVQAVATHRVRMRYRPDVTPECRFLWIVSNTQTIALNIISCPPTVGESNMLEIMCYVAA